MTTEESNNIETILSDLQVLSDKCSRDIHNDQWINSEYYLEEFNKALEKTRALQPEKVTDITPIAMKHYGFAQESGNQRARLYEVDATASKLLDRLKPRELMGSGKDALTKLEMIFRRFHNIVRQLRERREDRSTLDVKDEYDVQDLLHGLLLIFFNDIRPEEWTPSYAGSANRMDFLLKEEKVVVEVKKTSDKVRDKQIGNQLIEDIARYGQHQDCRTLVCFVYDPEGFIANSVGLENDLCKQSTEKLGVTVCIFPK